jgi:hypothetical protein
MAEGVCVFFVPSTWREAGFYLRAFEGFDDWWVAHLISLEAGVSEYLPDIRSWAGL